MDSREIIENKALETKKNEVKETTNRNKILKYDAEENKFILSLVKALFFLILALSGNFLAETLSCQTQKIFQHMYAKHIVLFFMIYFTIDIVERGGQEPSDPAKQLMDASILYIAFHLFTKMDFSFTIVIFLMLCAIYIIGNYRNLYEYRKDKLKKNPKMKDLVWEYEKTDKNLQSIQMYLYYGSIAGILTGSFLYFLRKKQEYGNKFSLYKFFEGVEVCKSLR